MATLNKIKIQLRNDTTANWSSKNPTLLKGELAFDQTTRYVKIGDGTKAWKDLDYIHLPKSAIDNLDDVNENTIYQLSASTDGTKFQLLSADGTLAEASRTWTKVYEVSAKDWTTAISNAQSAATTAGQNAAKAVENKLTAYVKYTDVTETPSTSNKIVTQNDIKDLTNVMHFLGTITPSTDETDAAAAVRTYGTAKKGDVVISTKSSKEYVYVSDTAGQAAGWREFGDESTYATATKLTEEVNARTNADKALSSAIDSVKTDLNTKYSDLTAADSTINNTISTFKTNVASTYATKDQLTATEKNLKAVDTALSGAIDSLNGVALSGVSLNGNAFSVSNKVASFTFNTIECGDASLT